MPLNVSEMDSLPVADLYALDCCSEIVIPNGAKEYPTDRSASFIAGMMLSRFGFAGQASESAPLPRCMLMASSTSSLASSNATGLLKSRSDIASTL